MFTIWPLTEKICRPLLEMKVWMAGSQNVNYLYGEIIGDFAFFFFLCLFQMFLQCRK